MVKLKIYVFRHGQTYFNREGKFTGSIDSKLDKKGREDAKIISERLWGKEFEVAFYTRLSRSWDTLCEVLKHHPECKKLIKDDRMIERLYGKLQGKTHWQVVKEYGVKKYDEWHRGFRNRPPAGESFADVEKRVRSFIKFLVGFMKRDRVNVAVSASGNSIRLFRKIMEEASEKEACGWFIPYDNYYEYSIEA